MCIETKINRVIASCITVEQAGCAAKYVGLAANKRLINSFRANYWLGVISGIAHVKGWE